MVKIEIDTTTFATLLAGLYTSYKGIDVIAVPSHFWLGLAETMIPYMEKWDYDVLLLEEWINKYLIITLKEILTEEEIEEFKNYPIYIEVGNGNATLVGAGDLIWMNSTDTLSEMETNM